tara:strand:- start:325 stop:996 length:672 start_codon:yes stop_codon:yes gene_type:complete
MQKSPNRQLPSLHPFPTKPLRLSHLVLHASLQLALFVLYMCAVGLDVRWWRQDGPICDAAVICRNSGSVDDLCDSMRVDLQWLLWGYTIGVAFALNKLVVVAGLLISSTEAILGMLLIVPLQQASRHSEQLSRLLVCAAWGVSTLLDAGLLFSLVVQVVVTHIRSQDYAEELYPDATDSTWGLTASIILATAVGAGIIINGTMLTLAIGYYKRSRQAKADSQI